MQYVTVTVMPSSYRVTPVHDTLAPQQVVIKKKRRLIRSFEIIMSIINNQYSFNNNNHVDNVTLHEPKSEVLI